MVDLRVLGLVEPCHGDSGDFQKKPLGHCKALCWCCAGGILAFWGELAEMRCWNMVKYCILIENDWNVVKHHEQIYLIIFMYIMYIFIFFIAKDSEPRRWGALQIGLHDPFESKLKTCFWWFLFFPFVCSLAFPSGNTKIRTLLA